MSNRVNILLYALCFLSCFVNAFALVTQISPSILLRRSGLLLRPFSSKVSRLHRPLYAAPVPGKDTEEWMGCKVISNEADAIGLRNIAVEITDSRIGDAYTNPG